MLLILKKRRSEGKKNHCFDTAVNGRLLGDPKPLQATAKRPSPVVNFVLLSPLVEVFFEK